MEAELEVGHIVRLLTTQYCWMYDADVNHHRYVAFKPGTLARIHAIAHSLEYDLYQLTVRVVGTKEKLKMSTTVVERVDG